MLLTWRTRALSSSRRKTGESSRRLKGAKPELGKPRKMNANGPRTLVQRSREAEEGGGAWCPEEEVLDRFHARVLPQLRPRLRARKWHGLEAPSGGDRPALEVVRGGLELACLANTLPACSPGQLNCLSLIRGLYVTVCEYENVHFSRSD